MPQVHDKMGYNRTYSMPISYTVIIRSAGAKCPPEYSDSNLIVKTQCVKQMWLSGKCRVPPVVSVRSKTQLTRQIQSSLQHGTVVAVWLYDCMSCFFYTCHCRCHWSLFHSIWLITSHFPSTLHSLRMSVLNSSSCYDSFIGMTGFRIVKL